MFCGLDLAPVLDDFLRVLHLGIGKDVRVPVLHLFGNRAADIIDAKAAFARAQSRLKHDLEQDIAQLIAVLGGVVVIKRFEDFVRFLDQVRA